MTYPTTPPKTEEKVQINAYAHALVRLAIIIGIKSNRNAIC